MLALSVRSFRRCHILALAGILIGLPTAVHAEAGEPAPTPAAQPNPLEPRVKELEETVRQLQEMVRQLDRSRSKVYSRGFIAGESRRLKPRQGRREVRLRGLEDTARRRGRWRRPSGPVPG
jgi:hypothetical protein